MKLIVYNIFGMEQFRNKPNEIVYYWKGMYSDSIYRVPNVPEY